MPSFSIPEIPETVAITKRFEFVKDIQLRENLAIELQYIVFEISAYEIKDLSGTIKYSIAKNIIVHTASVVEAILHYWIQTRVKESKSALADFFALKIEYKHIKDIIVDLGGNQIVVCKKVTSPVDLDGPMPFNDLIKAARHSKKLTEKLLQQLVTLQGARNKLHLKGLGKKTIVLFEKKHFDEGFETAKALLDFVDKDLR